MTCPALSPFPMYLTSAVYLVSPTVPLSSLLGGGLSSLVAWLSGTSTAHRSTLLLLFCNLLLLLIFCSSYASLSRMEEIQRRIEGPFQR